MSAGMIHSYPVTATEIKNTSFLDVDQDLGAGLWESQKVSGLLLKQLMLSENVQQILQADLVTLAGASGLTVNKTYLVDGAVGGDRLLRVIAATASSLYQGAFDLTTGETGVYVLGSDTFYPIVTNFKKTLTAANILAGNYFDIAQLPAVSGAYWRYEQVDIKYTFGTIAFDGGSKIEAIVDGAGAAQFADDATVLAGAASIFGSLLSVGIITASISPSIVSNAKGQIYIDSPSTVGDGTLTIYGTARLVTL
jgi:hypothetical protein